MSTSTSQKPLTEERLEQALKKQISNLVSDQWDIVHDDLPILPIPLNHRSREKIPGIQVIKQTLRDKLGYISVYAFINMVGRTVGWLTGPHNNVDNILVILYLLVENKTPSEFKKPSESTIRRNLDMLFKEKQKPSKCKKKPDPEIVYGKEVRKWASDSLKNMFSNPIIRLITAKLTNTERFDFGTLFIDGHDNRLPYGQNTIYHRKDYISFKFSKTGIRTQVLMDNQQLALGVSDTLSCGPNTDCTMWKNMDIHSLVSFSEYDVIFFDGVYLLSMNDYIERCEEEGKEFNWNNFRCPIRKKKYEDLDESELEYNEQFGAFRGMIETFFAHFSSKFKIFGSDCKWKLCENFEQPFNMKLQVCLVLFNIQRFCEKYNIEPQSKHVQWMKDNFEFPHEEESEYEPTPELQKIIEMNNEKRKDQNNFLSFICDLPLDKQCSFPPTSTLHELKQLFKDTQQKNSETNNERLARIVQNVSAEEMDRRFDELVGTVADLEQEHSVPNENSEQNEPEQDSEQEEEPEQDSEQDSEQAPSQEEKNIPYSRKRTKESSDEEKIIPRTQKRKNRTRKKQKRVVELTPPSQSPKTRLISLSSSVLKKLHNK